MNQILHLESFQRAWLRKKAHHLKPVVSIGQSGVSDAVEKALVEALEHHELVKVKLYELKDERKDALEHLAQVTSSALVSIIGNVGIFYRPAPIESERQFRIPTRPQNSKTAGESKYD